MATLQERNGSYRILFVYQGKRHAFTVGKVSTEEAETKAGQVDYLLLRLKQGYESLPTGMGIVTFMELDGKPPKPAPEPKTEVQEVPAEKLTLGSLRDQYLATHSNGTLEQTTLDGVELHFKHLLATLGPGFSVSALSVADLQRHVDRRARKKGTKGKRLSPATIKKEIVTLRTAWNWAVKHKFLSVAFSSDGLRYPKSDEKPDFMTWAEIERRLLPGVTEAERDELWDCLFLTEPEIEGLLEYVKENASQPWVYPAVCLAAHTGARRSEIFRARIYDVDLAAETVVIHEKKRARGKRTTRRVALSPFLVETLKAWLDVHPGGSFLFVQDTKVIRSRTKRTVPTPVTPDEAHDHLRRTLAGSKWKVLKGWHTLRHSFISCCAARGVDQRIIDDWVGHTTEDMRRRYRHLIPSAEKEAIRSVFGDAKVVAAGP
ncbi:recombinase XerD [Planctomycetaceae bacterium SCGC AG-212-D15]|nr:recombinase XerD [Planctomycetaceae bacterium SCGC AG-212-D15]